MTFSVSFSVISDMSFFFTVSFRFCGSSDESFILRLQRLPFSAVGAAAALYNWHVNERCHCIINVRGLSTDFVCIKTAGTSSCRTRRSAPLRTYPKTCAVCDEKNALRIIRMIIPAGKTPAGIV